MALYEPLSGSGQVTLVPEAVIREKSSHSSTLDRSLGYGIA